MFKLVRYFSILGAVAISVLTALLLHLYNRDAVENLTTLAGAENAVLTRVLVNGVWRTHGGYLSSIEERDPATLRRREEAQQLHADLTRLVAGVSVIKISFFQPDGHVVYSTDPDHFGRNESNNAYFRRAVTFSLPQSRLETSGTGGRFSTNADDQSTVETYVPILNDAGKVMGVLEIYRDVSEGVARIRQDIWWVGAVIVIAFVALYGTLLTIVRFAEGELRRQYDGVQDAKAKADQAAQDAEHANRAKSEFLAVISHEIRTPLNGILGMSSLLLDGKLDKQHREFAETINVSGLNLLEIINDVLDVAKIESGRFDLETAPFNLLRAVEGGVELLGGRAFEKNIELSCRFDPKLPDVVVGDQLRLRQILLNLIGNAIKFTDKGGVEVIVEALSSDEAWSDIKITVADTGIGIDPDIAPRLFDKFVQADSSASRKFGGTGLGLSICRELVELMQGSIKVDSVPGEGSRFSVELRLPIGVMAPGQPIVSRPVCELSGKRVLIMDGPVSGPTLEYYVEKFDGEAYLATDIEDAKGALDRGAFDVVLMGQEQFASGVADAFAQIRNRQGANGAIFCLTVDAGKSRTPADLEGVEFAAELTKPVRFSSTAEAFALMESGRLVEAEPQPQRKARAVEAARLTERILVAEDNPNNQFLIKKILEHYGYELDIAGDGAEAIEMFAGRDYGLVLMDIRMPSVNGLIAAAEIKKTQRGCQTPILALSAGVLEQDKAACDAAGMCDFIAKPISPEELIAAVEQWMPNQRDGAIELEASA